MSRDEQVAATTDELRAELTSTEADYRAMYEQAADLAAENRRLRDALTLIANANTKYPSTPSGFTGDWGVLRDEARAVLTEDELGVWE